jgi:hypothetical protein
MVPGIIAIMASVLYAQLSFEPARGFSPGMSQLSGSIDNIDIASGTLHLRLPIASLSPGNGGAGFSLNLHYSSRIHNAFDTGHGIWQLFSHPGWHYDAFNYALDLERDALRYRLNLILPDGGSRVLMLRGHESADGFSSVMPNGFNAAGVRVIHGPLHYYTIDGSYLRVTVEANGTNIDYRTFPWNAYYPDGSRIRATANEIRIFDRNENETRITRLNFGQRTDFLQR